MHSSLVELDGFATRRVDQISGGQQQRVALARALAPAPRVLLLDEPLSNLDPALRERTRRQIRQAVERVGITAVWVTHEQEEAFDVGDRVAVLHRGLLDQVGAPEELYLEPRTPFVARFVGRASMVEGVWGDEAVIVDEGGRHQVEWEAKAGENLDAGDEVSVYFRPEGLELCASNARARQSLDESSSVATAVPRRSTRFVGRRPLDRSRRWRSECRAGRFRRRQAAT